MSKILVVEDDDTLAHSLKEHLECEGNVVELVFDCRSADDFLKTHTFDLIILDVNLPDKNGMEFCSEYREGGGITPVLILTDRTSIDDKEKGLDSGADDYLGKPFSPRELSARIRAILRRAPVPKPNQLEVKHLVLQLDKMQVLKDGEPVRLNPKEFAVLEFLMRNPNQVFSQDILLDRVWPVGEESSPEAVRQCISRLRSKIDIKGNPSVISTISGFGYTIEVDDS